jgi:hypothetical protein
MGDVSSAVFNSDHRHTSMSGSSKDKFDASIVCFIKGEP